MANQELMYGGRSLQGLAGLQTESPGAQGAGSLGEFDERKLFSRHIYPIRRQGGTRFWCSIRPGEALRWADVVAARKGLYYVSMTDKKNKPPIGGGKGVVYTQHRAPDGS